jgi:hypothetical protein
LKFKIDRKWLDKAEKELGETQEIKEEKLDELRKLLSANDNVPKGREDDAFLLRFLRAKKFDTEKAFKMVIIIPSNYLPFLSENLINHFRCKSIIR